MSTVQIEPNEAKLKELILYVAQRSSADPWFGATKLNKLLWAADFMAYGMLGVPLTGVEYAKRRFGPAVRRMLPIQKEMQEVRDLAIAVEECHGRMQKRPVALREADLSAFSREEIVLVNDVLASFRPTTATEISEWSHGLCGWAIAKEGETIPYEAVFISDRKMTAYEAERGRQLALERGWNVF